MITKLQEKIKKIKKSQFGAISISKNPNSKFYNLRTEIIKNTNFLNKNSSISDRIYCIQNNLKCIPKCKCGCNENLKNIKSEFLLGHGNRLSYVKEKKIKSYQRRFNCDNPSKSDKIKKKKIATYNKNYNSDYYFSSQIGKNNLNKINLKKYGVKNQFERPEVKKIINEKWIKNKKEILIKRKETAKHNFYKLLIEDKRLKNKVIPLFNENDYKNVETDYLFKCKKCNTKIISNLDDGKIPICKKCYPNKNYLEQEIFNFLKSLNLNFIQNTRSVIPPLELDFYFSDKKLAIEFNGNYWHSELNNKDKNYHLNKTNLCKEKGIQLIHIFEDEWVNKRQIVKSRLKHLLGKTKYRIGARKCIIREIKIKVKNNFLNKYHIQGEDRSSIKLGAFYKDRLVAVMTFGKPRFNKIIEYELIRFCTVSNFTIIGIANKLFSYFKKTYELETIISYADIRWSNGNVYEKLGFKLSHISKPNYWYMHKFNFLNRIHRFNFRKNVLKEKLDSFNDKLSERINMQNNNFTRIWDCGNLVFKIK